MRPRPSLGNAIVRLVCTVCVSVIVMCCCGAALSYAWQRSAVSAFGLPSLDWPQATHLILSLWLLSMPLSVTRSK